MNTFNDDENNKEIFYKKNSNLFESNVFEDDDVDHKKQKNNVENNSFVSKNSSSSNFNYNEFSNNLTDLNNQNNNSFEKNVINNFENNKNLIKKIKTKNSSKHKKLMLFLKIIIVLIAVLLGFGVFSIFNKFNKKLNLTDIGLTNDDEIAEKQISDITNIALLGIDDNNVSDAMLIASINKMNKKINLISIARDSLVKIEPKNQKPYFSKINEAFSNGGEQTTLKTLNKNFNLRLMDYVTINYNGLMDVVDEIDGIDLNISKKESIAIDGLINSTKTLKKRHPEKLNGKCGDLHLNGAQAVAYARDRKTETQTGLHDDFGRNYRQRIVLETVFKKIMELDKTKIPSLIKTIWPHVKTSLSFTTILNLYKYIKGKEFEIVQTQIPLPDYTINCDYDYNGKSTVYYDLEYAGNIINEIIYNDVSQQEYVENNPPKIKKSIFNNHFKNNDGGSFNNKNSNKFDGNSSYSNSKKISGNSSSNAGKPSGGNSSSNSGKPGGGNSSSNSGKPGGGNSSSNSGKPGGGNSSSNSGKPGGGNSSSNSGKPGGGNSSSNSGKPGDGNSSSNSGKPGGEIKNNSQNNSNNGSKTQNSKKNN